MKTYIKVTTIAIFSAFAFTADAQNGRQRSSTPYMYKEVVRVSNKNVIEEPRFIVRSVSIPAHVISKDVQKPKGVQGTAEGNFVSKGYPEWAVSKRVNRIRG